MAIVRTVLFKTKPGTTQEQKQAFIERSLALRKNIPGLISLEIGPSLDDSRAHGYDMGITLVLESRAHVKQFAEHPLHLKLHDLRESISDGSLAFMIETTP